MNKSFIPKKYDQSDKGQACKIPQNIIYFLLLFFRERPYYRDLKCLSFSVVICVGTLACVGEWGVVFGCLTLPSPKAEESEALVLAWGVLRAFLACPFPPLSPFFAQPSPKSAQSNYTQANRSNERFSVQTHVLMGH